MRWLVCGLTLLLAAPSYPEQWETQSEEEALFLRRISDFWREGEYQVVKAQIEEFLQEYPASSFSQTLHATLGDLYIRENNFKGALMQYARVEDPALSDRVFLNRMQCLLELQWFATLADECESFLEKENLLLQQRLRATYLLATALYQQCLNLPEATEHLQRLAERALPYFQNLLKTELSREIAQAAAHLYCILGDNAQAAQIYFNLAETPGTDREEMLFQAALLQAQYDKPTALQTFRDIAEAELSRGGEALYNSLALSYDCGEYEKILQNKEDYLSRIPVDLQSQAQLFFGRCHLKLSQYPQALQELLAYAKNAEPSDIFRSALIDILESSYRLEDETTLSCALERFSQLYPNDPQLPKASLSKALLLKKQGQVAQSRELLESIRTRFPNAAELKTALFEQIHLEFHEKQWLSCRILCRDFLCRYADSAQAPYAWRFLAASSSNLAAQSTEGDAKEQLIFDLESLLMHPEILSKSENCDWTFLYGKTNYELKRYEESIKALEPLLEDDVEFSQRANTHLLLALCYRDGLRDYRRFCEKAEEALSQGADLVSPPNTHVALFNGYLEQGDVHLHDKAAEHLYQASLSLPISPENLLWMADYYYDKKSIYAQRASDTLERFLATTGVNFHDLDEPNLMFESALVKLAELYGFTGQSQRQMDLLLTLRNQQQAHPDWAWKEINSIELLLAKRYEQAGSSEEALSLYEKIAARNPTLRSFSSAFATLKGIRLRLAQRSITPLPQTELVQILAQLKTLSLQKTLANEPLHLEAALEYVDLQVSLEEENREEKRLSLLAKVKEDFESQEDLLSKDYHAARLRCVEKNKIYSGYLRQIEAEILHCQFLLNKQDKERNHLLQNVKRIYEEILTSPATDYLAERARRQLEQLEK